METITKKRHNKTIAYKKNTIPIYMNIEEYSKMMDLTQKEAEKNKEIHLFEEKISNIYEEIKNAINEFCEKLKRISKTLDPNENDSKGKLQKIICNLLDNSSDALDKIMKKFDEYKENSDNNALIYTDYSKKLDEFYKSINQKIDDYNKKKNLYLEEVSQYEAYLINRELGLLDPKNCDENNKKENKKKKDKDNHLIDNHLKVIETQENYLAFKNDLSFEIKKIIGCINTDRKLVFNSLIINTEYLFKNINIVLKDINNIIEEVASFNKNNSIKDDEFLINEENTINTIFKDELYSFKFLSYNKENEIIEEDLKNKKKKKDKKEHLNIDSLLGKLEDENIMTLIKELKKNEIKYNKENEKEIAIIKEKKKAEDLAKSIITDPEKFNKDKKNELISLFKNNINNQKGFIQFLNNYRANGNFELKKESIIILCDLFTIIVEKAVKDNNYKLIQIILILSLTYYHIDEKSESKDINKNLKIEKKDEDDNNKIYMTKYLKESKPFHEKKFWLNYLNALKHEEIEKLTKRKEINISDKQKSIAVYSSVFTLIKNMIDYDSDFIFINSVLEEAFKENKFSDNEKQDIVNFLMAETQMKNNNAK